MTRVPLYSRGCVVAHAVVDDDDAPAMAGWRWHLDSQGYPSCRRPTGPRAARRYVGDRMHVMLLGRQSGLGVDHRNGDKLDNRRANLRRLEQAGNCQNLASRRPDVPRGAYLDRRDGKWYAQVKHRGVRHTRSGFASAEEAGEVARQIRAELLPYDERGQVRTGRSRA